MFLVGEIYMSVPFIEERVVVFRFADTMLRVANLLKVGNPISRDFNFILEWFSWRDFLLLPFD